MQASVSSEYWKIKEPLTVITYVGKIRIPLQKPEIPTSTAKPA